MYLYDFSHQHHDDLAHRAYCAGCCAFVEAAVVETSNSLALPVLTGFVTGAVKAKGGLLERIAIGGLTTLFTAAVQNAVVPKVQRLVCPNCRCDLS